MATKTKPAPEQPYLPGQEPKKHLKIHRAAQQYAALRDERQALLRREIEARDKLADLMTEAGMTTYAYLDVSATLDVEEKIKVKVVIGGPDPAAKTTRSNGDGKSAAAGEKDEEDEEEG